MIMRSIPSDRQITARSHATAACSSIYRTRFFETQNWSVSPKTSQHEKSTSLVRTTSSKHINRDNFIYRRSYSIGPYIIKRQ